MGEYTEYVVKEYAYLERVTPNTVYKWICKGAVQYRKTAGGGYRIIVYGRHPLDQRAASRTTDAEEPRNHSASMRFPSTSL